MRIVSRPLRRVVVALIVVAPLTAARAQARAAGAEPPACVAAAGPDSGAPAPLGRDSSQRGAARAAPSADTTHPTVRLVASVAASEVRFAREPRICVSLRGDARLDSVRVVGRRNLASPVVRDTTYRDVYVAVEILGHLNAECISARITGAASTGRAAEACAAASARTSGSAGRAGGGPPR